MFSSKGEAAVMDANWVPAFGAGVVGSAVAWVLSWRIASTRMEERTQADLKRAEELRVADLKRAEELRSVDAVRTEELRADLRDLKRAWDDGIDRVGQLASNMAGLQATQNQVNIFTSKAIEGITDKMERHEQLLADHTSTIRLIVDKVMTK